MAPRTGHIWSCSRTFDLTSSPIDSPDCPLQIWFRVPTQSFHPKPPKWPLLFLPPLFFSAKSGGKREKRAQTYAKRWSTRHKNTWPSGQRLAEESLLCELGSAPSALACCPKPHRSPPNAVGLAISPALTPIYKPEVVVATCLHSSPSGKLEWKVQVKKKLGANE